MTPMVTAELLAKYDRQGPRYTSYPTAVEFHAGFGADDYAAKLREADAAPGEPWSLYFHLPFCEERCSFCGCNVIITRKREVSVHYLDHLKKEVHRAAALLPHRRGVAQLHWGGGTPTYLRPAQMEDLHRSVLAEFRLAPDAEVAIEVDPRVTTAEQVDLLRRLGFNRLSMGVQDFTPEVQEAIHRNQTFQETEDLFRRCRAVGFLSLNIDLIYGLPLQTSEGFARNLEQTLSLRPDRVAVYSYAYVPWIKGNQRSINPDELPSRDRKFELFARAQEAFLGAGYVQIGMDHFALPADELALALAERRLHRNFMGYTTKPASDMIGFGVSSIGDVGGVYAQNTKKLTEYYRALDSGRFPVERGYRLSEDDLLRRFVITSLMCNFHLDRREVERRFGVDFASVFAEELRELTAADGPVSHGFLEVRSGALEVTPLGRFFIRNLCMVFDRHLRAKKPGAQVFSRTV